MLSNPLVLLLIGFVIGLCIATLIYFFLETVGVLRIDRNNPEKDVYRLEIDDLDKLIGKKRIILKIDQHANLSQK